MSCKRVDSAEFLTLLMVKNHVQGVAQYLIKLDGLIPMDMSITIPFASIQRPLIEHHNLYQESSMEI